MASSIYAADVMLSRLARWLRMLGVSVIAPKSPNDDALIRQCVREDATLITRDVALSRKAADYAKCILIRSNALQAQVLEFCALAGFDLQSVKESAVPSKSICPVCNGRLHRAAKASVKSVVAPKSFASTKTFWRCASCSKVYWHGSHDAKILEGLRRLKALSMPNPPVFSPAGNLF
ncbi:MAG: Mut7-C RNAse domain-containing protein [Candidatus Micrarchaeota archaeon]